MNTIYPLVTLGIHVNQVSLRNKGKHDVNVYSVTNSEGFKLSSEFFKKEVFSKNISNYKVVEKGQFAYNPSRINVGSIDYLRNVDKVLVSPLYIVFETDHELNPEYLLRYLKSGWGNNQIRSNTEGAVRDSLKYKGLENIKIPLPLVEDQKRIAKILVRVENLISQRKKRLKKLDELLRNLFLDLFGDPVKNEKGWVVLPCDKAVVNIESGTSYGGEEKDFLEDDELGVLKISAVTNGRLDKTEFKAVKKSLIKKKLRFIKKGDLLFSRANTVELVAACCVVDLDSETLFLPDKLWALTLADGINIQYFNFLLKNERFRNKVRNLANGGHDSMLNISMKKFLTLDIPVPEEQLQNKFAGIVKKVEAIKSQYQQSLIDLEDLYGSISQKAFKGELDLSLELLNNDNNSELDELLSRQAPDTPPDYQQYVKDALKNNPNQTMNSTKGRLAILRDLFFQYLNPSSNNATLEEFWAYAQDTASDYSDLENDQSENSESISSFSLADYDLFKDWVFQQIRSNKFSQNFINDKNVVQLRVNT